MKGRLLGPERFPSTRVWPGFHNTMFFSSVFSTISRNLKLNRHLHRLYLGKVSFSAFSVWLCWGWGCWLIWGLWSSPSDEIGIHSWAFGKTCFGFELEGASAGDFGVRFCVCGTVVPPDLFGLWWSGSFTSSIICRVPEVGWISVVGWWNLVPTRTGGPISGVAGDDMAIGVIVSPAELDDDRVWSTIGLFGFGSAPEKVDCSVVNLPSVNFGAIFLNLAGSFEGGSKTDVFADNLFTYGDSGARSSSEVVVVLSYILGLLVLFCPACFVELCLPER